MANPKMRQAARGGMMDRVRSQRDGAQKPRAQGMDPEKSRALVDQAAKGASNDAFAPPQRSQRPTGFDADAFSRQMANVGTAQGTREAQASQSPADPDPENEADLPNFAAQAPRRDRRRLAMRSRMGR